MLCVASSGIAATLLPGGTTSHSRFKIPLAIYENTVCSITVNSQFKGVLLQNTGLIIWDEISMQHKNCFTAVHKTLCDIRKCDEPFDGIPIILRGDFAQILSIIRRGNRAAIVNASLQRCYLWPKLRILALRQNMRVLAGEHNRVFAD